METPKTLQQAIVYFSNPDNCNNFIINARWADGKVRCPHCDSDQVSYLAAARLWKCYSKHSRQKFSLKVGTIFEDSPLGLDKWLASIWLIANAKNGISSCELARAIGVTQKSAWHMLHRIRLAMHNGTMDKLTGEVEVDETYIGGKARNMHKSVRDRKITGAGGSGKVAVLGLLERHGQVRTMVVPNAKRKTLAPIVRDNVEGGAFVFTDALASYNGLDAHYVHQVINHAEEYVRGNVHTSCIDNYWSLLKRALGGTYISVEPFHLFRYLDEQSFRFNGRKGTDSQRFEHVLGQISGKRLRYKQLIGEPSC
jgi:transposase-like protein